jgi:hypothetical protein
VIDPGAWCFARAEFGLLNVTIRENGVAGRRRRSWRAGTARGSAVRDRPARKKCHDPHAARYETRVAVKTLRDASGPGHLIVRIGLAYLIQRAKGYLLAISLHSVIGRNSMRVVSSGPVRRSINRHRIRSSWFRALVSALPRRVERIELSDPDE